MASDWLLKASLTKFSNDNEFVDLGRKFTSSNQIIRIDSSIKKSTWDYGGEIFAAYLVAGQQTIVESYKLKLKYQQLIKVPLYFAGAYSLYYQAPKWLTKYTIKVFEYQKMALYLPDSGSAALTASTAVVTSVTVQNNTTPTSLLAANTNRKRFSLRNKGTKDIYLGFSNNFTAANAYLTLAKGAVYESDINFTGEIFGLAVAANSPSDIAVIEFI
jgi:hypothetical protein